MAETKKLVLVVENTATLGRFWGTILSDYVEKVIRSLCGDNTKPDSPIVEMALILFNSRGPHSPGVVQRGGWIKNLDYFMEMVTGINFSGGGACDVAIAEGLADVLMMLPPGNPIQNQQNVGLQKHCVLVAASNPYPIQTAIYIPPSYIRNQSDSPFSDAETIAQYFKQSLVSFSVICPWKLPKLQAIYDAAKRNPSETEQPIGIAKNPNHLVLISEDFVEARAALTQPEITNLPSTQSPMIVDRTPNEPAITNLPSTQNPMLIDLTQNEPKFTNMPPPSSVGNTVSSMASVSSSSLPTSQEMTTSRKVNPGVSGAFTKKPPLGISSLLNTLSQSRPIGENISRIINENTTSSVPVAQTVTPTGQTESARLPTGTTMPTTGKRSLDVATNVDPSQQTTSALQSQPSKYAKLSEGNISSERQRRPVFEASTVSSMASTQSSSTLSTSQGMTSSLPVVQTVTSSGQASATLPAGTSTGTQKTSSARQTKRVTEFVKLWEGNLIDARQGQNVVVTPLEGYMDKDVSEPLEKDWPSTLQIERLLSPMDVNDNYTYNGGVDYVFFKVKNEHVLLEEMKKKNLYSVVKLPLHTMLLYIPDDNASRLIGMLFPKDDIVL